MTGQLEAIPLYGGPMDGAVVSPRHVRDGWLVRNVGPKVYDAGGKVLLYHDWCNAQPTFEVSYQLDGETLVFRSMRPVKEGE